jgi:hypothetical protein
MSPRKLLHGVRPLHSILCQSPRPFNESLKCLGAPVLGHGSWPRQPLSTQQRGCAKAKAVERAAVPVGQIVLTRMTRQRVVRQLVVLVARLQRVLHAVRRVACCRHPSNLEH